MASCGATRTSLLPSNPVLLLPHALQPSPKHCRFCHQSTRDFRLFVSCSSAGTTPETFIPNGGCARGGARKRLRYRKPNPGEEEGIVEEMRFVAMRLRNTAASPDCGVSAAVKSAWQPTVGGFLRYLVDSKLVFDTLERIVEDSTDVTHVYFRRTGLERSISLSKDLEWFEEQGEIIPPVSAPGTAYAAYLEKLAVKNAPSFLCHFYNIYFAHIFGGCGIGKLFFVASDKLHVKSFSLVSEKLLGEREIEFYKWEGDVELSLKNVRQNLNKLGEDTFTVKPHKKSPLALRMVVLGAVLVCSVYICSVCLKQMISEGEPHIVRMKLAERTCHNPRIRQSERRYVHFPKPKTFSR
ncbi:putative inactive heme oxygenase 2, chloroplastic [Apostasia shenzhenica]|uniref:Putative inactive heme oxygenase 2, chloroplastic n=1 Tax=Apostasia shenzhenica TaxID=1088818 RepID=A0A2I0A0R4_9ASPA|nr:putative inactive heme oxygenase 2, chloroplastic [Apostasia shenzhenica]